MDTDVQICFENHTEIEAERNGTCFITDTKPDFPDDLSVVTVSDPSGEYELHNAELVKCASIDGRYWFTFRELSADELYRRELDEERIMALDLMADQEYRLCMIDLGLN